MQWWRTFDIRHEGEEHLDDPATLPEAVSITLHEQAWVNRWLGGGQATWKYAVPFLSHCASDPLHILEIGIGGGDISRKLADDARNWGKRMTLVGVDRNLAVLRCARALCSAYPEMSFVHSDACMLPFPSRSFDLVLLPSMLHHLEPEQVLPALQDAYRVSRGLLVVSDVIRSPMACLAYQLLARCLGMSAITREDGIASLRRAYTPRELAEFAGQVGFCQWQIHRHPFYRMTLVVKADRE